MNLTEFYQNLNNKTDKGTSHDYIVGYYDNLFTSLKRAEISLLELGVQEGYSFDLWRSWFEKAKIICFDLSWQSTIDSINSHSNSKGFRGDAFNHQAIEKTESELFDFIIEDGPHTVPTQIFAAEHWSKKLKVGGKLIIEDIQNPEKDVPQILAAIKNRSDLSHKLIDLRPNKGRYDDYIIELTKIS